jgi:hypothetical protein
MSVTAGSKSPRDLFLAALKLVPEQRQAYLDAVYRPPWHKPILPAAGDRTRWKLAV